METRASYTVVGAFVLGLIGAAVFFVLWLAGSGGPRDSLAYRVHFDGDVTGLQIGATVRYKGIPVGEVTKLDINREKPDIIEAHIRVAKTTPIAPNTVAALEVQGLTGSPFVQLKLRRPEREGAPVPVTVIQNPPDKGPPIIAGEAAGFAALLEELPKTARSIRELADRAADLLNDDMRRNFARMMSSATEALDSVKTIAGDAKGAIGNIKALADEARPAVASIKAVADEAKPAFAAAGEFAKEASVTAKNLTKLADDAKPMLDSVKKLADEAVPAIKSIGKFADSAAAASTSIDELAKDARPAVAAIRRMSERIDPAVEAVAKAATKAAENIGPAFEEVRRGAKAFADLSSDLRTIVRENRRPIADFAATGLYELSLFLTDMRQFIRTFDRLLTRLESDPSGFLFGNRQRGFETQGGRR